MKRNCMVLAIAAVAFAGASCEKHRWENKVKEQRTPIYTAEKKPVMVMKDGKQVQQEEVTMVIEEQGAKSFFWDEDKEQKIYRKVNGEKEH